MLDGEGGDRRCSPVGWVDSAEYFAKDFETPGNTRER